MNLLVNAAHAIAESGTITIASGAEGDDRVWIEISDTGCGIAPEHLPHIYEPFFTTKPVGKGTGLGLALTRDIVHRHRGEIAASSTPGQGTSFRVSLPVRRPEEQEGIRCE
jgi:signal transduction histidine kinase